MASQEVKIEKLPWAFMVVFLVLLGLLGEIWVVTQATGTYKRPAAYFSSIGITVACYTAITALPFLAFFVCGALGRLGPLKGKVTPTMMTYIYVMTCCASFYFGRPTADTQCAAWASFIGARYLSPDLQHFIPWFMAPPLEIADQIRFGGVAVPWGELMPTIIFWSSFTFVFGVFMVCIATLFRRSWIDIEKVPFPHAISAHELMKRVDPKSGLKLSFTSPFVIGMIVAFAFGIPSMMIELFPWFPDIYGFRTDICGYAAVWNTPTGAFAGIIGLTKWNIHPLAVAIAYIAPLNILFNVWFWWLVDIVILPQIAYSVFGYYTGLTDRAGCCRWDGAGPESLAFGPPFKWQSTVIGGIFGLALFLFVIERRYIVETVQAALGRVSAERKSEMERNEALSYRTLYALIVVLFIAMVAILMSTGMNLGTSIVTPISMFILWFAQMRMLGLSGAYVRGTDKGYALQKFLFYPTAPSTPTNDYIMTANFNTWFTDAPDMGNQIGGNYLTAWQSYRLASFTGVSSKSVFKIMIVSILILAPTTMSGFLYSAYTWGAAKIPGTWGMYGCAGWYQRCAVPEKWNAMPGTIPWYPNFLAGFLMAGFLSIMHSRYMWFPFEPVGFIIGTSWTSGNAGFWLPCLVAWVLKVLTIRVGGSKLYEHQGLALAAGFIAGYMACAIPGTIISKVRFFYPF